MIFENCVGSLNVLIIFLSSPCKTCEFALQKQKNELVFIVLILKTKNEIVFIVLILKTKWFSKRV